MRAQVRVPTNIVSSICDDRGEEPTYNGVDMSTLIEGAGMPLTFLSLQPVALAPPPHAHQAPCTRSLLC
jgi:hypothetical protein